MEGMVVVCLALLGIFGALEAWDRWRQRSASRGRRKAAPLPPPALSLPPKYDGLTSRQRAILAVSVLESMTATARQAKDLLESVPGIHGEVDEPPYPRRSES